MDHFPVVRAFGFRARFDGRSAVLSGDTSFCESLARASEGADLLVCEAMNVDMMTQRIALLQAAGRLREAGLMSDVPSYHIGTHEIARMAEAAGVGEVMLSHIIPPLPSDDASEAAFMQGMSDLYRRRIRVARDMQRVPIVGREA